MTPLLDHHAADLASGTPDLDHALRNAPVVLFGAGNLGQRILKELRYAGIQPSAFADNNRRLWGKKVDALEVLSPEDAAERFGAKGIVIIATWRPAQSGGLRDLEHQLGSLGCRRVIPFPQILWTYPEQLTPHYLWDLPSKIDLERDAILRAAALFDEMESNREFRYQVEFRKTADIHLLPPLETHPQYFPEFLTPLAEECFVDCGAYDGDTLCSFLQWTGGRFRKFIAFEADPANCEKLRAAAAGYPETAGRIECRQEAVAASAGTVRFDANGQAGAAIRETGGMEVKAVALDEALAGSNPTFIKMDIEGAEIDALRGARDTIRRAQPVLAICAYHRQSDLWRIPLLLHELLPAARLFLKSYCLDGLDTVCYAVPEHRLSPRRLVS